MLKYSGDLQVRPHYGPNLSQSIPSNVWGLSSKMGEGKHECEDNQQFQRRAEKYQKYQKQKTSAKRDKLNYLKV